MWCLVLCFWDLVTAGKQFEAKMGHQKDMDMGLAQIYTRKTAMHDVEVISQDMKPAIICRIGCICHRDTGTC